MRERLVYEYRVINKSKELRVRRLLFDNASSLPKRQSSVARMIAKVIKYLF